MTEFELTDKTSPAVPFPMFPLGTVLLPDMLMPIHIFEERYRVLARETTRHLGGFGVVLIERGTETDPVQSNVRSSVATTATVLESFEYPDGRWLLVVAGAERVRVHAWLPDDPYPVALVSTIAERPLDTVDVGLIHDLLVKLKGLFALLIELGEDVPDLDAIPDDPTRATWFLCGAAPVGDMDRQTLLETDEPSDRLRALDEMLDGALEIARFRLSS